MIHPEKTLAYYLDLPYTIRVRRDEAGDYVARVEELQGCAAHGSSRPDAIEKAQHSMELWLEDALAAGEPIPEPAPEELLPSGKWVQRVPRSLHKKLIEKASREATSLNQLVTSMLAEAIGERAFAESFQSRSKSPTFSNLDNMLRQHLKRSCDLVVVDWNIEEPASKHGVLAAGVEDVLLAELTTAAAPKNIIENFELSGYGAEKRKGIHRTWVDK